MSNAEQQSQDLEDVINSGARIQLMRLALEIFEVIKTTNSGDQPMTQNDFANLFINAVRRLDNEANPTEGGTQ